MSISIILVNYNGAEFLAECLNSLAKFINADCEVIVIDNSSTDNSVEIVRTRFTWVRLICSEVNLGFGKANNLAVERSQGKYLLFLNTDTLLTENTPQILAAYLDREPDVAAIGARITFQDGSYQLSSGMLPNLAIEFIDKIRYGLDRKWHGLVANIYNKQYSTIREVGWVTGACLMIHRDIYQRLGGFDPAFFMYFEDKDLCKRVRDLEFKVIYYPGTSIIHLLGGSSKNITKNINNYYRDSQLYYYQKHLNEIQLKILKFYLRLSGKI
ncbi:glycosyltransferase family 2 protein [Chamaesiphon minutus]|uniref:Putative glycosyltransferase n=1 Tax=Chamaesiphon minutus (strain ATCC 27169 / PCC 6605) TaxID=1173020 RepID=K9U9U0_CHAP6|nr:glycosyltransferase family 2 protein [Chamaesiphon minutus]AFY91600.1 putative glycosyltransferase [Chamaesiphon minutus PCC 6605]